MGHRISRPATMEAATDQAISHPGRNNRCSKATYIAASLALLAYSTNVGATTWTRAVSSSRPLQCPSQSYDVVCLDRRQFRSENSSGNGTHSDTSLCFVGVSSMLSERTHDQLSHRKLHEGVTRLNASVALPPPTSTISSDSSRLSPTDHRNVSLRHSRKSKPFLSPPVPQQLNATLRRTESHETSSQLSGSRLSLNFGSSSRWEPIRLRQYNEAARRKKRQKHLLRIVRDNRHGKAAFKLQFKDEGFMHNEASSLLRDDEENPLIDVSVDFSHAHEHEKIHHKKKCLVLRKDRHGKIRTFWTKPAHREATAFGATDSTADLSCNDDETELSVCTPLEHECAASPGVDVEEAKIPKPSVRKSEAEGYAATDVTTLRKIFGENRNKLWGDLDPETTRILYHTLLPRALLRLHAQGLTPDELAPLAYEARCAAKQYARERCNLPGRVASMMFDGIRHVKSYGKWSSKGLSWDQIWEKYEQQVLEDLMTSFENNIEDGTRFVSTASVKDLTTQVCKKILERSCSTNGLVDRVVMSNGKDGADGKRRSSTAQEVLEIANKFDQEIHELINSKEWEKEISTKAKEFVIKRTAAKIRKKLSGLPFYFPHVE